MSLSARFGKAEEKSRSGGQKQDQSPKTGKSAVAPPRGPKGGMKQGQRNDSKQKNNGKQQKGGKQPNRGPKGPKNQPKPKKKTQEELDLEIDAYTLGKEAALSSKLDDDMDSYNASRGAAATSSSAPES